MRFAAFGILGLGSAALTLDLRSGQEIDLAEPETPDHHLNAPNEQEVATPTINGWMSQFANAKDHGDFDWEAAGYVDEEDLPDSSEEDSSEEYDDDWEFNSETTWNEDFKLKDDGGDSKPTGNCMNVGEWRPFFNVAMHTVVDSASACQQKCQMISDCTWWQWISNDRKLVRQRQYRGLCELKTCMAPVAKDGYGNIRVKSCTKTFCDDPNSPGGKVPQGGQIITYAKKPRVSGRVKRSDYRTYKDAIYNGPKDCNTKPNNCTDDLCVDYNTLWLGGDMPNGAFQFDYTEVAPMEQCRNKCSADQFCKFWTLTYGPEMGNNGPYYCSIHSGSDVEGQKRATKQLNNAYSGPQDCAKCKTIDVINMTANGKLEEVSASEKEMYSHVVDNCHSSSPLTGTYNQEVQTSVTKTESLEMSRTLSESFSHSLSNKFSVSLTLSFTFFVTFSTTLSYSLTDTRTMTKTMSETTSRIQSETRQKMTAVQSGFQYTVPPGRKLKIQSQSKRLDGVLPWTANSRCLDAHGHMVEENNMFGNYKSYGLSTSEVLVTDLACPNADSPTQAPTSSGGICDMIFTPGGACHACGMEPVKQSDGKTEVLEWICNDGCQTDGKDCLCVPPFIYDGNGRCKPANPQDYTAEKLLDGIQYAQLTPLDVDGKPFNTSWFHPDAVWKRLVLP